MNVGENLHGRSSLRSARQQSHTDIRYRASVMELRAKRGGKLPALDLGTPPVVRGRQATWHPVVVQQDGQHGAIGLGAIRNHQRSDPGYHGYCPGSSPAP